MSLPHYKSLARDIYRAVVKSDFNENVLDSLVESMIKNHEDVESYSKGPGGLVQYEVVFKDGWVSAFNFNPYGVLIAQGSWFLTYPIEDGASGVRIKKDKDPFEE